MRKIGYRCASHMATADFPAAVGPQMTGTTRARAEPVVSAPTEATLELIPREVHDGGTAVNVVRRQRAVAQRDEQRAHLRLRQRVAGLDGRLARNRRGQLLVPGRDRRLAVARQRG